MYCAVVPLLKWEVFCGFSFNTFLSVIFLLWIWKISLCFTAGGNGGNFYLSSCSSSLVLSNIQWRVVELRLWALWRLHWLYEGLKASNLDTCFRWLLCWMSLVFPEEIRLCVWLIMPASVACIHGLIPRPVVCPDSEGEDSWGLILTFVSALFPKAGFQSFSMHSFNSSVCSYILQRVSVENFYSVYLAWEIS